MTLTRYTAHPYEFSYEEQMHHVVAQLFPQMNQDDVRYVVESLVELVKDRIREDTPRYNTHA